eukprot:TRINITY_DN12921_c0_g1_i1.p1 TRINITY_DN12921_c0_g1~~TRINITY_DN12921_c0_g1_i1.p1  ORF type:complete len:163 (+),score=29.39 TRINITY_DN12921_c0_g1_i1:66-554(+)
MSAVVRNLQFSVNIKVEILRRQAMIAQKVLRMDDKIVTVICTSDDKMNMLNQMHRRKQRSEDLLTFLPNEAEMLRMDLGMENVVNSNVHMGDIYLGMGYIKQVCDRAKWPLESRCGRLIVHGICHLAGYKHRSIKDHQIMKYQEKLIVQEINKEMPETPVIY